MNTCCLLVEHDNHKIKPITYELLSAAWELQKLKPGTTIRAIILGSEIDALAEAFAEKTGLETIQVELSGLTTYHSEIYLSALSELIPEFPIGHFLAAHSTLGLDLIPALAVRLQAGCLTAIEKIEYKGEQLVFRRSICGGKLVTQMSSHSPLTFLTVQPGSFKPTQGNSQVKGLVKKRNRTLHAKSIRHLETKASQSDNAALKEAKVIVAVGRGIGEQENIAWIRSFSQLFTRSAVAGSRPLCDLGWLNYNQQVGITGATVSPDLYIACGISGTSQHVTGMKGSGFIVSINKDPKSAMFTISDLCIVEDLKTFLPIVIEQYRKQKTGS